MLMLALITLKQHKLYINGMLYLASVNHMKHHHHKKVTQNVEEIDKSLQEVNNDGGSQDADSAKH